MKINRIVENGEYVALHLIAEQDDDIQGDDGFFNFIENDDLFMNDLYWETDSGGYAVIVDFQMDKIIEFPNSMFKELATEGEVWCQVVYDNSMEVYDEESWNVDNKEWRIMQREQERFEKDLEMVDIVIEGDDIIVG
jgi:hypothetical protein